MKQLIKILLFSLAAVPLIRDSSVFFPDSAGKIFFTRLILTAIGATVLYLISTSKDFREELGAKIVTMLHSPIALALLIFALLFSVSAILALDTYTAFWGDVQRGEGLVGIIYFFALFIFSILFFDRKDWVWFFKLSLITAGILLWKEFSDFFIGVERPGSFVGNPTFLAGYLLFSILASLFVLRESEKGFWRKLSITILCLSIPGIFLTETRGAMAGLLLGLVALLLYGALKGGGIYYRNYNLRKVSVIILSSLALFTVIFLLSRSASIWQSIPGLARVATISGEDISTQTRLIGIETSLEAVSPQKNGVKKLLLGWGPNNYILAFGQYYNPEQYRYEIDWFDRAHNKLLDVLVMNGALALIAYLAIWFFYFKHTLRREFNLESAALAFFGISFFIHLLFVFDNISTSVPFFLLLGFLAVTPRGESAVPGSGRSVAAGVLPAVLALFLCFAFFRGDVPAYMDMKEYISVKRSGEETSLADMASAFTPFTVAQKNIRQDFLVKGVPASDGKASEIVNEAFDRAEEYIERVPDDFRFLGTYAGALTRHGNKTNNDEMLVKGEKLLRKTIMFSPLRPDFNYSLALNLTYQESFNEAREVLGVIEEASPKLGDTYYYYGMTYWFEGEKSYSQALVNLEKAFSLKPALFLEHKEETASIYSNFVKYFYDRRDKESFTLVARRLIENSHPQAQALEQVLELIAKGAWPQVQFNQ